MPAPENGGVKQMAGGDTEFIRPRRDLTLVLDLIRLARHVHGRLIIGLALLAASTFLIMAAARELGTLISALLGSGMPIAGAHGQSPQSLPAGQGILRTGAMILAFEFAAILTQYAGSLFIAWTTTEVALTVRRKLFLKLATLPISFFDREPLGRTITRLTADVESMENFFSSTLSKVAVGTIRIAGVLIAMLATDLRLGAVAVLFCLPSLAFPVITKNHMRTALHQVKRLTAAANSRLAELIASRPLIRHYGLEKWSFHRYDDDNAKLFESHEYMMNLNSVMRPVTVMLCSLPVLAILLYGGLLTQEGVLTVATFVTFLRLSERFVGPIRTISQEIQVIQDALASSERVARMLVEENESQYHAAAGPSGGSERPVPADGGLSRQIEGRIEFREVSMSYGGSPPVLSKVSFLAPAGVKVGLVGRTGSGKSTTMALIAALYRHHAGEILIDGVPIDRWNRQALRSQIGIINQEVEIFRGTLRDNLLAYDVGGPGPAADRLAAVCDQVELTELISRHPDGLDQMIAERGRNLSAGQRQLIAFARLLLRDPRIIILDEATSNIDPETEGRLHRVIKRAMAGRTGFLIAHRLQTIRDCDTILVYLNGRIVEHGPYDELVAAGGYFSQLHSSGGEIE